MNFNPTYTSYLKTSLFIPITLICLLSFLVGFISNPLSIFTGIILSFFIIMRAKPDGILGLFLLYFFKYHFFLHSEGSLSYDLRSELIVFGLPLSVAALVAAFVTIRVVVEIIFHPLTFKYKVPKWIIFFWLIAFIPVTINLYLGSFERNPNWTNGMRFLMIIGCYFYGYILAKNFPITQYRILNKIFVPLIIIMLTLHFFGFWWMHLGFLFLGLAGAFSIYYIRYHSSIIGLVLLFLTILISIQGSFTTLMIGFFSIFLSFISNKKYIRFGNNFVLRSHKQKYFSKFFFKSYVFLVISTILLFSFVVAWVGYPMDYEFIATSRSGFFGSLIERLETKIFHDRVYFWSGSLRQILSNPYIIVPSGQGIEVGANAWLGEWVNGAHNSFLELLRVQGVIVGSILILLLLRAIKVNFIVLYRGAHPIVLCLSSAVLSIAIVGMTTSDFPITETVGFFLWSFAGLAHGLFLKHLAYNDYVEIKTEI